jgi:hypothetical protein
MVELNHGTAQRARLIEASSCLAIDLAHAVCTGQDWHGHKTNQGCVLYLAAESPRSILERAHCVIPANSAPFLVVGARVDLMKPEEIDVSAIAALIDLIEARYFTPVLLTVFDTLSLSIGRGEENDNGDAAIFMPAMTRLAELADTHVMGVHHCGKDATAGPRGASAIVANCDTVLGARREDGDKDIVALVPEKQRSMPKSRTLHFRIGSQVLGQDSDGDVRTTPLIEIVDPPAEPVSNGPAGHRTAEIDRVEERLRSLYEAADAVTKDKGLAVKQIVEACSDIFPGKTGEALRKAVTRCLERIVADADGEIVKECRGGYRVIDASIEGKNLRKIVR